MFFLIGNDFAVWNDRLLDMIDSLILNLRSVFALSDVLAGNKHDRIHEMGDPNRDR